MQTVRAALPEAGFLRINDLCRDPRRPDRISLIPISRCTLWRWVREGRFPEPVRLGGSGWVSAWPVEVVAAWMDAQHSSQPSPALTPKRSAALVKARRVRAERRAQAAAAAAAVDPAA
jgi:predicted DNA-binding transcriptional regulator AlpA